MVSGGGGATEEGTAEEAEQEPNKQSALTKGRTHLRGFVVQVTWAQSSLEEALANSLLLLWVLRSSWVARPALWSGPGLVWGIALLLLWENGVLSPLGLGVEFSHIGKDSGPPGGRHQRSKGPEAACRALRTRGKDLRGRLLEET